MSDRDNSSTEQEEWDLIESMPLEEVKAKLAAEGYSEVHLTLLQQKIMHRALRRSVRIVDHGK